MFTKLLETMEKNKDMTSDIFFRPPQIVKLVETCDLNVDISYKTVNWRTDPTFKVRMKHAQYDTVLMCELETKIKAKKQAE